MPGPSTRSLAIMQSGFTFNDRRLLLWLVAAAAIGLVQSLQPWLQLAGVFMFFVGAFSTSVRNGDRFLLRLGPPPATNRIEGWVSGTGLLLFVVPLIWRGIVALTRVAAA